MLYIVEDHEDSKGEELTEDERFIKHINPAALPPKRRKKKHLKK